MNSTPERPMRADARRNRERIIEAAGELLSLQGERVQMEQIAERAGIGMGTLYRHFATKQALLEHIVARRFEAMAETAADAARLPDRGEAFEELLRAYLSCAAADAAFRYAVLGPEEMSWDAVAPAKRRFAEVAQGVIDGAIESGGLRADFTFADFVLITRGLLINMQGEGGHDWQRHLDLTLTGLHRSDR